MNSLGTSRIECALVGKGVARAAHEDADGAGSNLDRALVRGDGVGAFLTGALNARRSDFHGNAGLDINRPGVGNRILARAADGHAVGVPDGDGAFIDGRTVVVGHHALDAISLRGILVGRKIEVDRALVGVNGIGTRRKETVGTRVNLARDRHVQHIVSLELHLKILGRRRGVAGIAGSLFIWDLFGNGAARHKRSHRSSNHRLRALGLDGGRQFVDDHQGATRLAEHNFEILVHVFSLLDETPLPKWRRTRRRVKKHGMKGGG